MRVAILIHHYHANCYKDGVVIQKFLQQELRIKEFTNLSHLQNFVHEATFADNPLRIMQVTILTPEQS